MAYTAMLMGYWTQVSVDTLQTPWVNDKAPYPGNDICWQLGSPVAYPHPPFMFNWYHYKDKPIQS